MTPVERSILLWVGAVAGTAVLDTATRPAALSTKFQPARLIGGSRRPEAIRLIVLHSTESSGTAASVASYFQSPSSGGSSQVVVGPDGAFQCVPDLKIPAGAPGANEDGLHLEVVGMAKWTRQEWLRRERRALELASQVISDWGRRYDIPLRFLDAQALKDKSARGVTTHNEITKAFKKGDHWDPGPGFPLDLVLERARMMA